MVKPKCVLLPVLLAILLAALLSACQGPSPLLALNKGNLILSSNDNRGTFGIRNDGEETSELLWSVRASSPLVTFKPPSGRLRAGGPQQVIEVTVDQGRLSRGEVLLAQIEVRSNGGTALLELRFEMLVDGLAACGTFPSGTLPSGTFKSSARLGVQAAAPLEPRAAAPYAPGQLLVQFGEPGLAAQSLELQTRSLARLGLEVASAHELMIQTAASPYRPALVALAPGEDPLEVARRLMADPRVAYAEPNYYLGLLSLPDDPLLRDQWNLLEFGLLEAWAIETGTRPVVIAIIDSGVDINHEDLSPRMRPGCDFANGDNDPSPVSSGGQAAHGTHVAGIAAAAGNNGLGVAGVAHGPGVGILPVKVFTDSGQGTVDKLLDAMLWSAGLPVSGVGVNHHPARVINMSLGVDPAELSGAALRSVDDAARRVRDAGAILFAASGNRGNSDRILAPASSPFVLAVGSVGSDLRRSSFSNYATSGATVDFMGPGGSGPTRACSFSFGVLSTYPDDTYTCLEGTSMAAPFVAGTAALLLSQEPGLSVAALEAKLRASTLYQSHMSPEAYGAGVVCPDRALGAATLCGR